jgi:hypothetical protein
MTTGRSAHILESADVNPPTDGSALSLNITIEIAILIGKSHATQAAQQQGSPARR